MRNDMAKKFHSVVSKASSRAGGGLHQNANAPVLLPPEPHPIVIQPGPSKRPLDIGSDLEVARRLRADLTARFGQLVNAEGAMWCHNGTHWDALPDHVLHQAVHAYDGLQYVTPAGSAACIKLNRSKIDSILHVCTGLFTEKAFFERPAVGINCASGFIRFGNGGVPVIEPHHPDHRARHTLPGHWQKDGPGTPPPDSLLFKLLTGVFEGDRDAGDKVDLLAEICGAAALGCGTKLTEPRAVILLGRTAENGKSQILDLARGLLPPTAICTVPAAKMADDRHAIGLLGKHLNATGELSAASIASERFKTVVTGEPIQGRDVYKSRVEFRPVAQHLFATNELPPFHGGMDRGVQRRLLVIPFNRVIPPDQRLEDIGQRIARDEADLLLAWAVDGASRLIRRHRFAVPASCRQALLDWIFSADAVLAWIQECVTVEDGCSPVVTRAAYAEFRKWAAAEGFKQLPAINGFVQRVMAGARGVEHRRTGKAGRQFLNMRIANMHASSSS
jgi:P4 family phage/plasmid primase-like protien